MGQVGSSCYKAWWFWCWLLKMILIAEDNADADAEVNGDGWKAQWARWAPPLLLWPGLPSVYLQLRPAADWHGKSTIQDAIRISNRLPDLPFRIYRTQKGKQPPKKLAQSVKVFCHEQISVIKVPTPSSATSRRWTASLQRTTAPSSSRWKLLSSNYHIFKTSSCQQWIKSTSSYIKSR